MSNNRIVELIALLVKAPRTEDELTALVGYCDNRLALRQLRLLRDEGLVYIKEWRWGYAGRYLKLKALYAWQPSICEFTDACAPASGKSSRRAIRAASDPDTRNA